MRKLIYALGLLAVALTSCSGDSDSPAEETITTTEGSRLRRCVVTFPDGTFYESKLSYSGEALSVLSGYQSGENLHSKNVMTYSGGKIVQIDQYVDNQPNGRNTYQYNANGLLTAYGYKNAEGVDWVAADYTYNAGNIVAVNVYNAVGINGVYTLKLSSVSQLYHQNNKLIKWIETVEPGSDSEHTTTKTYTYDGHPTAFRNIPGFLPAVYNIYPADSENALTSHQTYAENPGAESNLSYVYTYNAAGYPVSCKELNSSGAETGAGSFYYYDNP